MSTCPICKKPATSQFRPFCSRHCADVDLGRWFNGTYRLPSTREEDDDVEIESKTSRSPLDPDDGIR